MIDKEILINVAGNEIKVFMQNNFFEVSVTDVSVHKHGYTELHCVESGTIEYVIGTEHLALEPGEMVVIPAGTFHSKHPKGEDEFRVCIFQVNVSRGRAEKYEISRDIFTELIHCAAEYKKSKNAVKLSAYLSLVCSYIVEDAKNPVVNILEREFLVYEFFLNLYHKDVTLSDLAKVLNLSEKQTERAVIKYTGRHFRNELAYRRIEAAKYLLSTENITLKEAAERVGYKSYSGFWKAYKAYDLLCLKQRKRDFHQS